MATTSPDMKYSPFKTYEEVDLHIEDIKRLCHTIYSMNEEDARAAMEELNSYLEKMRHLWMVENDPLKRSTGGTVTFYDDMIRMTLSTIRARFPYKRSM